ncbi:hypothetical protein MN032_17595 [Agromyces atrinae]|uniref:hypothetical protein n=1 Tax=Agromyces atrinae TaxID=592376 RepID=UPI001F562358|nr:hypothetical protein [Agromyces atrinae]MCI2959502.1 hypothetical protein [Agromyces atrinae]
MKISRRFAAAFLAVGLVGGAGIVAAAPAQAVTETRENYTGYSTLARCNSEKTWTMNRLRSTGKEITAHTPCHYQDAQRKYMFQVWYI